MGRTVLALLTVAWAFAPAFAQDAADADLPELGTDEMDEIPEASPVLDLDIEPMDDSPVLTGTPVEEVYLAEEEDDGYVELEVKSRKLPLYPDELKTLYGDQAIRCEADVWVDAKGKPVRVSMVDCPDGFHMAALSAMSKWTWEKPTGFVPEGGVKVKERTGFVRRDRKYYPGVTYFRSPEEVTADPSLPVTLRSGKMPRYPRAVNAGDAICLIEVHVDWKGNSKDVIVDECATPYRVEMRKVLSGWKWSWRDRPAKGDEQSVVSEVVFRL